MKSGEMLFTSYMEGMVGALMDRLGSFYCREDIERKRLEVLQQYKRGQSGYRSRLRELEEMCAACGLALSQLLSEDTAAAELDKVPARSQLRKKLIEELHGIYREFPRSENYMERLVRRLLEGDFAEDSLRMAILKKFLRDTDYHTDAILSIGEKALDEAERSHYAALDAEGRRNYLISRMDEGIFALLEAEADPLSLLRFLGRQLRNGSDLGDFAFSPALHSALGGGESPEEALRALEKSIAAGNGEKARELIAAAEKEYCAWLKGFVYTKKKAKDPAKAQATRDEVYRQARKDFLKPMKKAVTLLKLADDLATGKFRANGATKEQLYAFAVAFGMTLGGERDIEKNLFHDYYNDNLLRYVLDGEYLRNVTAYETEPGGEGINYKNYVELIHIWYISKYPDMPPREKLKRIQTLCDRCALMARSDPEGISAPPAEHTAFFRDDFLSRLMRVEDEDELAERICAMCYIHNSDHSAARISYASRSNTAADIYKELAVRMWEEFPESFGSRWDNVELATGMNVEELLAELREENADDGDFLRNVLGDGDFVALLEKLDKKLGLKKRRIMAMAIDGKEPEDCTRSALISLYCCYFGFLLEELTEDFGLMDLPSIYAEFCEGDGIRPGINHYLEQSRYQKISPKNCFDMFAVFSLFMELIRWDD